MLFEKWNFWVGWWVAVLLWVRARGPLEANDRGERLEGIITDGDSGLRGHEGVGECGERGAEVACEGAGAGGLLGGG